MKTLNNRNIVIFSSVDWETHRQLHHELCDYLIKKKNKILFVENTGSRSLRISDISRIKTRIQNFFKTKGGFRILNQYLTIYTPLFIPFHFNFFVKKFNNFFISNAIINWSNSFRFDNPIIINFVPNPITYSLLKTLNGSLNIYYMADDMSAKRTNSIKVENKIMQESDLIFYTSTNLKKKIKDKDKGIFLPNGVSEKIFKNSNKINRKIKNKSINIGYVGAIRDIIDEKLILKISEKFPKDKIIFVGPVLHNFKKITERDNIILKGQVNHRKIPKILNDFDIGIIPYKVSNFTNSINPLKIYEYISAGLPVISTNLKSLNFIRKKNNLAVQIAKTENQFLDHISNLKKNYKFVSKNSSKKFLTDNSWNKRFEFLEKKIVEKEFEVKNSKKDFIKKLRKFYHIKKIKLFKYFSLITVIGMLFFYSSISNLLINKYAISTKHIEDTKILVVFTGFGHRSYHNLDYLNRAKDLLHYQEKYKFDEILIIGRRGQFDEGKLILDIFSEEFSKKIDLIADQGSSYKNIIALKKFLSKDIITISNLNIISSPIYTRRLDFLLQKNLPSYKTHFLNPTKSSKKEENLNLLSLIYELIATVYYKFKNYI